MTGEGGCSHPEPQGRGDTGRTRALGGLLGRRCGRRRAQRVNPPAPAIRPPVGAFTGWTTLNLGQAWPVRSSVLGPRARQRGQVWLQGGPAPTELSAPGLGVQTQGPEGLAGIMNEGSQMGA